MFFSPVKQSVLHERFSTQFKRAMAGWKFSLLNSMKDPELVVKSDDEIVIMKDKYPKSQFHYLVLPKADINSTISLDSSHLPIVKYMDEQARKFIHTHYEDVVFWLGYHARPSLQRLHLHLISDDFQGSGLKNAKHWNSYTTRFFLPSSKIIDDLEKFSCVRIPEDEKCNEYLKSKLRCHKCSHCPPNMPALKKHLETHNK
ncbi:aprataxin-like isoform X2 [Nilaparvata lugens]|uniref:aprataxin-like isoform X2 n=1 Tax=Nilaparvata lugens TaxID=108931 RepID=UPI00193CEEE8|nr:aprataxin-like isoform X2 [Nilaparvata lugens]